MNRIVIKKLPVGPLTVVQENDAIVRVAFGDWGDEGERTSLLRDVQVQLQEYFTGTLRKFALPLSFCGTPFQNMVWEKLLQIPYGQTVTYGQLAVWCGRPGAARAVGGAMHANPLVIVLPCHRVVGSDGKLTGFAVGLETKAFLLDFERRMLKK